MAQRLILVRHGDLGENCRGRYIGRTDAPLCTEGRRQAASLTEALGPLEGARILSSPLLRTRETAEIALGNGRAFSIDEDLREIDFGRWEGMGFDQIAACDPGAVERWTAMEKDFAFPDGEGLQSFRERIGNVAGRMTADPARTVVAFTHGGVIRVLICHFLGLDTRDFVRFDVQPASLSEFRINGGEWDLFLLNSRYHLEGCS